MNKEKNNSLKTSENKEGVERVSKVNDSIEENSYTHNISLVDRQEGEMDNGELGGNFKNDNDQK